MLLPGEFSVGCLCDATTGLVLLLPRSDYERPILVTAATGTPYAIFLAGEFGFATFECAKNESWEGVLVPNVRVEVDETSVFDARSSEGPLGSLVRHGAQLDMVTRTERGRPWPIKTPLMVDLPPSRPNMSAGFHKWRIVLGEGTMKRELKDVESLAIRPAR